jgi:ribose 5-phosphate isomerase A
MTSDELKRAAARAALTYVEPRMRLGLGSGSTANCFIDALAAKAKTLDLLCVPTSEVTRKRAESLGLRISSLDETPELDLCVDGADEIDPLLRLIKGGGGAHVREKIVALAAHRMIVIADESKRVAVLGRFPLPVEILPFGAKSTLAHIEAVVRRAGYSGSLALRTAEGKPFLSDNGNFICDASLCRIEEPERLALALDGVTGVVGHGLFIGIASLALIATPSGVETIERRS